MDTGSSVITLFGANLSNKPPDDEHPYGHGRYEYIASLVVSFIIFAVGFELLQNSFVKIIRPEPVHLDLLSLGILFISVLIKIWMYFFNNYIGKSINSSMNKATAKDSLSDAVATGGIIIGTIIGIYVDFPMDGVLGLIISGMIIYTGFTTAKDSVHLLLGPSPEPEILENISAIVSESEHVGNVHNIKIHDYGPGRILASMHVDVPPEMNVAQAHRIVHQLEEEIKETGIDIVIHMDPADDNDEIPSD